ncbi:MAG: GNAT family N-acetyltransferase [Corynebacterium sp.]|uniref:GNAT family N-acetyltransferase n=1 Tax=Corynebacterium sp. TaxID=1720 RepID=UPI0026DEAA77|nr:GNAT family N-acetyltransferase [Corynebacterium sp.]MDO5670672.1 GNAT family N-acetyltransferase [Corynebacterium sp.]
MIVQDNNQFVVRAGHTDYRDHNGERLFFHTEIAPEFSGQGLAGKLVETALAQTDLPIVAICPFVRGWLEKNDHTYTWRKPTTADLTWLQEELA